MFCFIIKSRVNQIFSGKKNMTKICYKCKIEKDESCFGKDKNTKDRLRCFCKDCRKISYAENKEEIKKYYQKNKEQIKDYYNSNKEQILEQRKKHYINNKDKIKEQQNNYQKQRRKIDPIFKLRMNISNTINQALYKQNSSKFGKSILQHLPYTINELKQHIESQWKTWMNWNNHGVANMNRRTWNIDHIIPQSSLPYNSMEEENFQKCWALENLRPMEAFDNLRKSNHIENEPKQCISQIEPK
jgi:chloramphenicol O-acetyltransferase